MQEAEGPETATDAWLTSEDSAPMMLYATLHWTYCYDQDCQMHRFKNYYPSPRAQHYLCIGRKKSWKECTEDACEGHIKPKIRNHWFPQKTKWICIAANHNTCRSDMCEVHIAGKRESRVFPGPHMALWKE